MGDIPSAAMQAQSSLYKPPTAVTNDLSNLESLKNLWERCEDDNAMAVFQTAFDENYAKLYPQSKKAILLYILEGGIKDYNSPSDQASQLRANGAKFLYSFMNKNQDNRELFRTIAEKKVESLMESVKLQDFKKTPLANRYQAVYIMLNDLITMGELLYMRAYTHDKVGYSCYSKAVFRYALYGFATYFKSIPAEHDHLNWKSAPTDFAKLIVILKMFSDVTNVNFTPTTIATYIGSKICIHNTSESIDCYQELRQLIDEDFPKLFEKIPELKPFHILLTGIDCPEKLKGARTAIIQFINSHKDAKIGDKDDQQLQRVMKIWSAVCLTKLDETDLKSADNCITESLKKYPWFEIELSDPKQIKAYLNFYDGKHHGYDMVNIFKLLQAYKKKYYEGTFSDEIRTRFNYMNALFYRLYMNNLTRNEFNDIISKSEYQKMIKPFNSNLGKDCGMSLVNTHFGYEITSRENANNEKSSGSPDTTDQPKPADNKGVTSHDGSNNNATSNTNINSNITNSEIAMYQPPTEFLTVEQRLNHLKNYWDACVNDEAYSEFQAAFDANFVELTIETKKNILIYILDGGKSEAVPPKLVEYGVKFIHAFMNIKSENRHLFREVARTKVNIIMNDIEAHKTAYDLKNNELPHKLQVVYRILNELFILGEMLYVSAYTTDKIGNAVLTKAAFRYAFYCFADFFGQIPAKHKHLVRDKHIETFYKLTNIWNMYHTVLNAREAQTIDFCGLPNIGSNGVQETFHFSSAIKININTTKEATDTSAALKTLIHIDLPKLFHTIPELKPIYMLITGKDCNEKMQKMREAIKQFLFNNTTVKRDDPAHIQLQDAIQIWRVACGNKLTDPELEMVEDCINVKLQTNTWMNFDILTLSEVKALNKLKTGVDSDPRLENERQIINKSLSARLKGELGGYEKDRLTRAIKLWCAASVCVNDLSPYELSLFQDCFTKTLDKNDWMNLYVKDPKHLKLYLKYNDPNVAQSDKPYTFRLTTFKQKYEKSTSSSGAWERYQFMNRLCYRLFVGDLSLATFNDLCSKKVNIPLIKPWGFILIGKKDDTVQLFVDDLKAELTNRESKKAKKVTAPVSIAGQDNNNNNNNNANLYNNILNSDNNINSNDVNSNNNNVDMDQYRQQETDRLRQYRDQKEEEQMALAIKLSEETAQNREIEEQQRIQSDISQFEGASNNSYSNNNLQSASMINFNSTSSSVQSSTVVYDESSLIGYKERIEKAKKHNETLEKQIQLLVEAKNKKRQGQVKK